MDKASGKRVKLNISASLLGELVTLICGIVIPSMMIKAFGSEVYGATTSIAQFLGYITLLESGVGGVTRAALYKPLAQNDLHRVSQIMAQVKRFFRIVALIFLGYTLVLACGFKAMSGLQMLDWLSTFFLVLVISITTFAQYFFGVANSMLLHATQRIYIPRTINIICTILNAVLVVLLIRLGSSIIIVKLVSSCVFLLRPIALSILVKRTIPLDPKAKSEENYLSQRWNALGQHIAWFLHSHTDVAVLTILADLKAVAVYSVYNMIISNIGAFVTSFTAGMEAMFGNELAKEKDSQIHKTFDDYETWVSYAAVVLYATTAAMILSFIRIYTAGVQDTNYLEPAFAIALILAALLSSLRTPYHAVVVAAGHFKQTQIAAYGEAVLNIVLSVALLFRLGLLGVALATVVATLFRFVFYVIYLVKNIMFRKVGKFLKRIGTNLAAFLLAWLAGTALSSLLPCDNYLRWAVCGAGAFLVSLALVALVNVLVYGKTFLRTAGALLRRSK